MVPSSCFGALASRAGLASICFKSASCLWFRAGWDPRAYHPLNNRPVIIPRGCLFARFMRAVSLLMRSLTAPSAPWTEGDGVADALVLHWHEPTMGAGMRVIGYCVEASTGGPFSPLVPNTGTKAPRLKLPLAALDPGSSYVFRVAAVFSGGDSSDCGPFSSPSLQFNYEDPSLPAAGASSLLQKARNAPAAKEMRSKRREGSRRRDGSRERSGGSREGHRSRKRGGRARDGGGRTRTVEASPVQAGPEQERLESMLARWELEFERRERRRPGLADKAASRFYSETARKLEALAAEPPPSQQLLAPPPNISPSPRSPVDAQGRGAQSFPQYPEEELRSYAAVLSASAGGSMEEHAAALSEEQLSRIVSVFRFHDTERVGYLGYDQFARAVRQLLGSSSQAGFEQMSLRAAFHKLDADHSSFIDFFDFLSFVQSSGAHSGGAESSGEIQSALSSWEADGLTQQEVSRAAAAFRRYDRERRGALSPRAFRKVVVKLGQAEGQQYTAEALDSLLRRADLDETGDIDFFELLQLLSRQKRILASREGERIGATSCDPSRRSGIERGRPQARAGTGAAHEAARCSLAEREGSAPCANVARGHAEASAPASAPAPSPRASWRPVPPPSAAAPPAAPSRASVPPPSRASAWIIDHVRSTVAARVSAAGGGNARGIEVGRAEVYGFELREALEADALLQAPHCPTCMRCLAPPMHPSPALFRPRRPLSAALSAPFRRTLGPLSASLPASFPPRFPPATHPPSHLPSAPPCPASAPPQG